MLLLIIYLLIALGVSFLCSILEAVLLSVPVSYVETKAQEGSRKAIRLRRIRENISKPLAAILALNTIAHTIGAAGVGAQATLVFGEFYFGIISAVLTLLILIFSEIIPKTIGAQWNRQLSLPMVPVLQAVIISMYPLVWLSNGVTRLFTSRDRKNTLSRDELAALARIGRDEGVLADDESRTINNLLRLRSVPVSSIMTPRTVLISAPEKMSLADFMKQLKDFPVSRIPLWKDSPDNITGYILRSEILEALARDKHRKSLADYRREIQIEYEGTSVTRLYRKLIQSREHFCLVVDEYGSVAGIATLEDIFETLIGIEIMDETDTRADLQELARERWEKRKRPGND